MGQESEMSKGSNLPQHLIYQFYAELADYEPKIWRRFQVAGDITVARLGYIVMTMYEMEANHLLAIDLERPLRTPSGRLSNRTNQSLRFSRHG